MSVPRHGREHQSPTRLDGNRYRIRKIARQEPDNGVPSVPGSDVYTKTYDDSTRVVDVKSRSRAEHDVIPPKAPVVDHRPPNQRIRLKRDSSGEKPGERRTPQSPGSVKSVKSVESVSKRGIDNVDAVKAVPKGQRRTLPSTPARKISYGSRDDREPVKDVVPVEKDRHDKNAHNHYAHSNQVRNNADRTIKSNPSSPRIKPKYDARDPKPKHQQPRTVRDEVIPLKEINTDKQRGSNVKQSRDTKQRGEGHRRADGSSGATVTFQMQEKDTKNWDSDSKRITSPKKVFYEKGGDSGRGRHGGTATVPGVHKHYLSPDGHPSIVEKSKTQNRLQNQSSTETSGLGETITSGFSSQESLASHYSEGRDADTGTGAFYDQGIDLSEDTRSINEERYHTFETKSIDSRRSRHSTVEGHRVNTKSSSPTKTERKFSEPCITNRKCTSPELHSRKRKVSDNTISKKPMLGGLKSQEVFLGPTDQLSNHRSPRTSVTSQTGAATTTKPKTLDLGSYNAGPNFDELFMQSENLPIPPATTMGLQVEQINTEWNKHNRSSSIKSRSSHGSFRSRSGSTRRSRRFLSDSESRWMKWGRDRRASFRRRLEKMEKPEPEVQPRASTPVKKARQEGLMFIHPDLESKYISEEDINYIQRHRQERLKTYKVIEKAKKIPYHIDHHELNRLTVTELNILTRFWEHRVFVRSRYVSILLSLGTILIYVISICSAQWISYPSPDDMNHIAHEGLWFKCRPVFEPNGHGETCDESAHRDRFDCTSCFCEGRNKIYDTYWQIRGDEYKNAQDMWSGLWSYKCTDAPSNSTATQQCLDSFPNWQNAVIGLMIFSAAFGFVAAVLAICGVCTSPLPKKIYYFHSAGEIFFVCALSTTIALIIYPIAIAMDDSIHSHTYGSGYGLGWGGTAFFFAASLCMSLDELVRESSQNKCCRYLCWRRRNDRGEHPV